MRALFAAAVLMLGAACDTRVSAKDYNQTCTANAECVVISEAEFCQPCGAVFTAAAINVAELSRYERERDAISKSGCPPRLGPTPLCLPPQPVPAVELRPVCNAGTCEARAP
ncbi:MAG: hypothetical protein Q8L14_17810 [Myxococcales bacterium]|nr:hypothetical protein [Myxococcales bacterium]